MSGWGGGNEWQSGPLPPEGRRMANLEKSNAILRAELYGRRKANLIAWLSVAAVFAAAGFAAGVALGETITIGSIYVNGQNQQGTTVTITPSDKPGEWARVVMLNRYVNQGKDDGDYTLPFDGVTIGVAFLWDAVPVLGSDQIPLTVPDGIVCVPTDCSIAVGEGLSGEIILLDWRGM